MSGAAESPLTAALVARAIVAAARVFKVEPATVFEPIRDGRGKARMLAAAALVHPEHRPSRAVARVMQLNVVQLTPSYLCARGIDAAVVDLTRAEIYAEAVADLPLNVAAAPKRGEAGWVHPRRSVDREERVCKARLAGHGPAEIAKREGVNVTTIHRILDRSGQTFPALQPGPAKGSSKPAPAKAPKVAAVRSKPAPRPTPAAEAKVVAPPRPLPRAPVRLPVEAHPAPKAAWRPLPHSTPVRLIDHRSGCRWPVETGARDAMVCDLPTGADVAYCPQHRWLATDPRERGRLSKTPSSAPVRIAAPADEDLAQQDKAA